MHPERTRRKQEQLALAQGGDWEAVYRNTVLWEFPGEFRLGFQVSFLAPFAVPSLARELVRTGSIVTDPTKRAYHTAIIMYELISLGLDSERGRSLIRHMNRAHRGLPSSTAEMTFVLDALTTLPIRFAEEYGWRPVLDAEREASAHFYRRLGRLLGVVPGPAPTWNAAAERFDRYALEHTVPSPEGQALGQATLQVIRQRFPAPARPLAGLFVGTLVPEPARTALALPHPPKMVHAATKAAVHLRARVVSRSPAHTAPAFVIGQPAGVIYPTGYSLSDITGGKR